MHHVVGEGQSWGLLFPLAEGCGVHGKDLEWRILIRMGSGMTHSKALSMRKRNHVPRRSGYASCRKEVAGGPSEWENCHFWALGSGEMTSNYIE